MDNRPIGVYDSGVGGLTVFKDLENRLENENYIYFGDTVNLPYGTKTKEDLIKIARKIFDFFAKKNVKAVVMACNTTSSNVYDELCDEYDFEIYPVIQTASKCIAERYNGKIGVFATIATINSNKYKEELLKNNSSLDVYQKACPDWVRLVEGHTFEASENSKILETPINFMLENNCENVILGCTHYPYLIEKLNEITGNKIHFINPSLDFVDFIERDLREKGLISGKRDYEPIFYVSSNPENFKSVSKQFYELKELPVLVNL